MQEIKPSSPWEQVAARKPKLRAHTRFYTHKYRGSLWHIVHDRTSTRHYRFTPEVMSFVKGIDGNHSVQEIFDSLALNGRHHPTKQDILTLLSQLHIADLLHGDMSADGTELEKRNQKQKQAHWKQLLMRPLAMRIPLVDPDRLLEKITPKLQALFNRNCLLLWAMLVGMGAVAALTHWQELASHGASHALDPGNLFLIFLIYPFVKTLHEFGHAVAAKHWGGEVHEMGIMLLVFMPVPYVDVTSANAFSDKWCRISTGAAGIMVELFLAAIAALLWINVQPGLVQDIAFNVMIIGGVSTVLFNGNPLLRFDGYYVLSDWLEIPNLAARSNRYLAYLVKTHAFQLEDQQSPISESGEKSWFLFYAITSFFYRMFISISIALFVAGKFFLVGVALAIWSLTTQLVIPLYKNLKFLFVDPVLQQQKKQSRAMISVTSTLVILLAALFFIPVPTWTQTEGVVKLPEQSMIRAQGDGFVVLTMKKNGEQIKKGDVLFQTEDPFLVTQIAVLQSKIDEINARKTTEFMTDRIQVSIFQNEIENLTEELGELQDRQEHLTLRSSINGEFRVSRAQDLPGRFIKRGQILGHVVGHSDTTAQVVVPQNSLKQVRGDTRSIEVRLAGNPGETLQANVQTETPSLSNRLPSHFLGTHGGGTIAVDSRDKEGLQSIEPIYQLEIGLPSHRLSHYIGNRVHVRFNHSAEPLAQQWLRSIRQLFLARFEV